MDDSLPAAFFSYQEAIVAFKKGKKQDQIEKYQKKYDDLKKKQIVKIVTSSIPEEITKTIKQDIIESMKRNEEIYKEGARHLSQEAPDEIYEYLAHSQDVIPCISELRKSIEKQSEGFIADKIFPHVHLDSKGNISKHSVTNEEKEQESLLRNYGINIKFKNRQLIYWILRYGILCGKVNVKTLIEYLRRYKLFQKLIVTINGQDIPYNWFSHIIPPIDSCLTQLALDFKFPGYPIDFIMPLDSLILKFEGMLRDVHSRNGSSTSKIKTDAAGRMVSQEKDINFLLSENGMKKLFNEDDFYLLQYILTAEYGWNLRNKVAHCLIFPQEYFNNQINYFCLLFVAILRIGKYYK